MKSDHYPVTTHLQKKPKPPPLDGGGKEPGAEGEAPLLSGRDFPHFPTGEKRTERGGDLLRAENAPNFFFTGKASFLGFREMQKIGGSN